MNTVQRLLSNTVLAFIGGVAIKAGNALLFILISRRLGPAESGIFTLGITYYTFVFGLSALGLHELTVREVAPRRDESGRYLVNFLALRVLLTVFTYGLLVLGLRLLLPYSEETAQVILILSLAAIPEAAVSICQSLFEAHERLFVPMAAAVASSGLKLLGGFWLLTRGAAVDQIAWVIPIAGLLSLLIYFPSLVHLLRDVPQRLPARLNPAFLRSQMGYLPSFFVIHLFSLLDYQTDALLISLILGERELGYYAAAQTILLAFNLMPIAIRTAIYPLMSRYFLQEPDKLVLLYDRISRYLIALVLPMAMGVTLLAGPIIGLIYGPNFGPAVPVLQLSIWAIVFLFLNVPHARLLLIHNKQREAGRMMGLAMALNVALNVLLIPRWGINGAAVARLLSTFAIYVAFYAYTQTHLMRSRLLPLLFRPLLAVALMALAVWPLRQMNPLIPMIAGAVVYGAASLALGVIPAQDLAHWQRLLHVRAGSTKE